MKLPILAGPLRGRWWLMSSRGKLLRVLLGSYEPAQTAAFLACVRPGDVVLDIGAHAGYYTLLAASRGAAVFAFEPDARNRAALERHVELNGFPDVRVAGLAVADARGVARFSAGTGSGTGRLVEGDGVEVDTVSLDEFCAEHGIIPTVLKVDVEGAEGRVLEGARRIVRDDRPVIFLSTHGHEVHRRCLEVLDAADYQVRPIDSSDLETATEVLATPRERG